MTGIVQVAATTGGLLDISGFSTKRKSNEGVPIAMLNPETGEPIGLVVYVLGRDSDVNKSKQAEFRRKHQNEIQRNSKYVKSAETVEKEELELFAALTTGWSPFRVGDREWVYSYTTAIEFYQTFDIFRDQVDRAIYDRTNFLEGNAKT